jgi:hypothetical protein
MRMTAGFVLGMAVVAGAGFLAVPSVTRASALCSSALTDCLSAAVDETTDPGPGTTVLGADHVTGGTFSETNSFGTFGTIGVTATSYPNAVTQPDLASTAVSVQAGESANENLIIYVTLQNITFGSGMPNVPQNVSLPLNVAYGPVTFSTLSGPLIPESVTESVWLDPDNGIFANAPFENPAPTAFLLPGSSETYNSDTTSTTTQIVPFDFSSAIFTGPEFSMTIEYDLTVAGNSLNDQATFNGNVNVTWPPGAVPEPTSLALLGGGLAGLGVLRRRRHRRV